METEAVQLLTEKIYKLEGQEHLEAERKTQFKNRQPNEDTDSKGKKNYKKANFPKKQENKNNHRYYYKRMLKKLQKKDQKQLKIRA